MYTPVPVITRKLSFPVSIYGVTFPEGSVIDLHPHLMHHNPSVWEDHMVSRAPTCDFQNCGILLSEDSDKCRLSRACAASFQA